MTNRSSLSSPRAARPGGFPAVKGRYLMSPRLGKHRAPRRCAVGRSNIVALNDQRSAVGIPTDRVSMGEATVQRRPLSLGAGAVCTLVGSTPTPGAGGAEALIQLATRESGPCGVAQPGSALSFGSEVVGSNPIAAPHPNRRHSASGRRKRAPVPRGRELSGSSRQSGTSLAQHEDTMPYVIGITVCALAASVPLLAWLLWRARRENANLRTVVEGLRLERSVATSALQRKFDATSTLRVVK